MVKPNNVNGKRKEHLRIYEVLQLEDYNRQVVDAIGYYLHSLILIIRLYSLNQKVTFCPFPKDTRTNQLYRL